MCACVRVLLSVFALVATKAAADKALPYTINLIYLIYLILEWLMRQELRKLRLNRALIAI